MRTLCVVLLASEPLHCISSWPTEKQCWQAGELWFERAHAWQLRVKGVDGGQSYSCKPPDEPPLR